jgi:hypothetical protein
MATESVLEPPQPAIVDDFGVDQQRSGSIAGNPVAAASMSSMRRTVRPSKPDRCADRVRSACEFGCIAFVGPVVWMSFLV